MPDHGFPPIAGDNPRVLILGSMPSQRSLAQQQYYGHPQNRFWAMMAKILGFSPGLPYPARCQQLIQAQVAVWDVIAAAERPGSMDADIRKKSIVFNDFDGLLTKNTQMRSVLCNGTTAHRLFAQVTLTSLLRKNLIVQCMPSTSPANARWRLDDLVHTWREALLSVDSGA